MIDQIEQAGELTELPTKCKRAAGSMDGWPCQIGCFSSGVRDVAGRAFERVCAACATGRATDVRSPAAGEAGPEHGTERRGVAAGDPDGSEGEPVSRRGPPQGEGTACGQGDPGRQEPDAETDAGERTAGAGAAGAAPRKPEPQRPDPDRAAGRAPGHGRGAVLDEGWCWFFAAIAHCASDVVGWHVSKIGAFIERYNTGWLLQRHGYMTPARAREKLGRKAA